MNIGKPDMPWPRKWLDVLSAGANLDKANEILNALHKAGALKDPPKAKEWYFCPYCLKGFDTYGAAPANCGWHDPKIINHEEVLIKIREVIEK